MAIQNHGSSASFAPEVPNGDRGGRRCCHPQFQKLNVRYANVIYTQSLFSFSGKKIHLKSLHLGLRERFQISALLILVLVSTRSLLWERELRPDVLKPDLCPQLSGIQRAVSFQDSPAHPPPPLFSPLTSFFSWSGSGGIGRFGPASG